MHSLIFSFVVSFFVLISCGSFAEDKISQNEMINETIVFIKKNAAKKDLPEDDLTYGALKGILGAVDSHSTYYTPKEYNKLQESIGGSFSGIGIYIDSKDGIIHVGGVIKKMPADKAGMKNDDYITHIDNESTFGMTTDEASNKLRGKKGTKINLQVARKDEAEPMKFTITRDDIIIDTVEAKRIDNILHVIVTFFNEKTYDELFKHLSQVKSDNFKYSGIVLDLRSNPGGLLDSAVAVSSLFLKKNDVIVQVSNVDAMKHERERSCIGEKNCRYIKYEIQNDNIASINDETPYIDPSVPLVVLVNQYSASASEITALAMQENGRGLVIGQKTFGKGSVQSVIPLRGGKIGAIKLTTSLYFSPKGNVIQANGVTPDISIPEFVIEKRDKRNSFFPTKESDYKNHLKPKHEGENSRENEKMKTDSESINDFGLQVAISTIKASIIEKKHNANGSSGRI